MRDDKDRSSKWMIDHHGGSVLRLAGIEGFRAWRAVAAEVVQPKRLPDGLLEVFFPDRTEADLFVVEFFTYPERAAEEQALRDALLVYADRNVLPEVITIVLQPRGAFRLDGRVQRASRRGTTRWTSEWLVVELWALSAADLLAANDVGLIPWVPLTQYDGPPEALIQLCRDRIDQQARPEERGNLLAVSQIMTQLRYNDAGLLAILGGSRMIIESPLVQELLAQNTQETRQADILTFLEGRFGEVPLEIAAELRLVKDKQKLQDLSRFAGQCPDLAAFQARLRS
jgi:hypothetical protein